MTTPTLNDPASPGRASPGRVNPGHASPGSADPGRPRPERTRLQHLAGSLAGLARNRSFVLFVVAAGFGLLAVSGARGYIAERLALERDRLNPAQVMTEVVVAKTDLDAGSVVAPETMAVRSLPADLVPGGALRPDSFEAIAGMRLLQPMRSGEPLLPSMVEMAREGGFSARIRHGIRAMTIQVDEVNSVSGMLQPGDRIDLLFTVRPPAVAGQPVPDELTAPLMQDLPILATGNQVVPLDDQDPLGRRFTTITVEVDPQQAQRLIVAQRSGRLTATLRNPDDRAPVAAAALDVSTLLGLRRAAPVRRRATGTELIVGGRGSALQAVEQPVFAGDLR